MRLPLNLLELPAEEAARLIALAQIEELREIRPRLGHSGDTEALHDFRVALRRLRTTLRCYRRQFAGTGRRRTRRRLDALADATRQSRDLEVHIAWARNESIGLGQADQTGVGWLVDRLEQARRAADESLEEAVEHHFVPTVERLEQRLRRYRAVIHLDPSHPPRTGAVVIGRRIQRLGETIMRALARVSSIEDEREAHRARIDAKRLRYVLEPLEGLVPGVEPVIEGLKQLQDELGDLHDSTVFVTDLERLSAEAPEPMRPGLAALSERLRARGTATFARLSTRWLGGTAAPFFGEVAELGQRLAATPVPGFEIERKYLLKGLPDAARRVTPVEMRQGYLPGTRLIERLREVVSAEGTAWYRTVKSGVGIARIELEEETTRAVAEVMWPLTVGRRLVKRRYRVPDGDTCWEIDEFTDRDLVLAEIELPSADSEVRLPAWLAPFVVRDVTDEAEYTNYRLAR